MNFDEKNVNNNMWKLEDSLKEFDINTNIDFGRENCNLDQSNIKVISRNDNSSKLIDDYFTFSKKKDNNNEENTSEKSIETTSYGSST